MSGNGALPTRVVMVSTSFPSTTNPAGGIFVARLARELGGEVPVTVIAPANVGDDEHGVHEPAVSVHRFRYAPKAWQRLAQGPGGIPAALRAQPWLYLLVPGFLAAMAVSVLRHASSGCVVHANWAITGLVAGLVAPLRGCPLVITLRGEDVSRARSSRLHRAVLRGAVRRSDRVVTVSDAFRDWLVQQWPEVAPRVQCVPNGVADAFLAVGEGRSCRDPAGSPVSVVTVGSLIPRKGIDQLLEAFAKVPRALDCRLTVVGDGPLAGELDALCVRLQLADRVDFPGAVAPGAIPQLLADADVFVLSSHSEGRPNAVLEAMAAGLPVIATDIDGVRELVCTGETGYLFRDGAVDELAAAIAELCRDPSRRRRLGDGGRRRIRDLGLLWRHTAGRYLQIYRQLAGAAG